ncbi:hypothetical protein OG369_42565 [Streptomyces sp. NBC_01221]|uniref:hypothetical protein n=1 Tax=Streptomyces sp. NBC_01221 TaxID=2903782 RepID=UPI00225190E1|nr:hypothetical protein [Streptomyces sp. NBC_01221]MCX4792462.1 hypothetical protein [Streptomyces sp. NBC_01221]
MSVYPIAVVVFAALTVGAGIGWWRLRALERLIRRERATVRLTEAAHHRDTEAFKRRIRAAVAEQRAAELRDRLLTEAEQIVTAEYARTTRHHPQEGETP